VLSTDIVEGEGFTLIPGTTRFGHSLAYLRQQAAHAGLTELAHEEVDLYPGISALQCAFRK
jgi:predicted TPR repeat methyltransferase